MYNFYIDTNIVCDLRIEDIHKLLSNNNIKIIISELVLNEVIAQLTDIKKVVSSVNKKMEKGNVRISVPISELAEALQQGYFPLDSKRDKFAKLVQYRHLIPTNIDNTIQPISYLNIFLARIDQYAALFKDILNQKTAFTVLMIDSEITRRMFYALFHGINYDNNHKEGAFNAQQLYENTNDNPSEMVNATLTGLDGWPWRKKNLSGGLIDVHIIEKLLHYYYLDPDQTYICICNDDNMNNYLFKKINDSHINNIIVCKNIEILTDENYRERYIECRQKVIDTLDEKFLRRNYENEKDRVKAAINQEFGFDAILVGACLDEIISAKYRIEGKNQHQSALMYRSNRSLKKGAHEIDMLFDNLQESLNED